LLRVGPRPVGLHLFDCLDADRTALHLCGFGVSVAADRASVLVLGEDDVLTFDEDGQWVFHIDAEGASKLHRDDDAAQIIDATNDSGVMHGVS